MSSFQGKTVQSGSKVVVQRHNKFKSPNNAGIAYVALSRSEELKDVYIKGELDRAGIHASPEALEETNRLETIFEQNVAKIKDTADKHWKISYLNVRSLLGSHKEDVKKDNFIMSSDVFSLAETWLKPGEVVDFDGFEGVFAGHGKGKGVSAFSKIECSVMYSIATEYFSSIHLRFYNFDVVFVYISSGCNKDEILSHFNAWIDTAWPTAIIGDFNIDYSPEEKVSKGLEMIGFQQLIQTSTRSPSGSLIDHIYINHSMKSLGICFQQDSTYYSDHDIITLFVSKVPK